MAVRHGAIGNVVPIRGSFETELQLIREAIVMVATGKSPRVTLAGIRHAAALLEPAQRLASAAGVDVAPLPRTDPSGTALVVGRQPA
jgi:hypothetical protein